ncbi:MAG: hypothetical protein IIA41_02885, partial [SAR324 cluster bacterium]|nr:hypothetical protein [SAR324 cluster bacterium]
MAVWKLHASGSSGNAFLNAELDAPTGAPGPELSFCVGTAWVSGAGSLLALK